MKSVSFLLPALLLIPSMALAQSIDISNSSNGTPTPVDLVINVKVDQIQNAAPAGLLVKITNDYNFVSRGATMNEMALQTDKQGSVTFHTLAGSHEIRISGDGIETFAQSVNLVRQQSRDMETIVVKSKPLNVTVGATLDANSGMVSAAAMEIPPKAAKEFKAGSKALDSKNYEEAKKRFANAISIYPNYSFAYNGMGVAQMASADSPAARLSFLKATQADPHFAEAYRNLARLSLAIHNFDEVEDYLSKSLQTEPLNAWALTYVAYAQLQLNKFDLAILNARAAHSVPHEGLSSVHIVAARALEATNQPGEAVKEYKLYLKEDPAGRDAQHAKQAIASLSASKSK
jgi:TolA-binding protein